VAIARAFVDDLNVLITCEEDLQRLDSILNEFCVISGASFNRDKTCIMGLGGWEGRTIWPLKWINSTSSMKILGITFYPHLKSTIHENWKRVLENITGQLAKHASRRLTIHQRNAFIKIFIIPQALHVAKILPCPEKVAEKMRKNMLRFVWYGKMERPDPGVAIAPDKE
jgi:hypothetical protein